MQRHRRFTTTLLSWAAIVLATSACTITILPSGPFDDARPRPSAVIERFESVRRSYAVGDRVQFRIATNRPGFVTLTAIDPDGSVYVIARNLEVTGRGTEILPPPSARVAFVAVPPTGRHVVRAHFTPTRTPERVVFRGLVGFDSWSNAISIELSGTGFVLDDVAEVRFDILR
ncbi:MAG: DUF4384 domain-containing protein [Trueperaceae bacterium]|nr:DUF4384 domain-containing protein [Trueperaceae bacterium]